MHKAFKLVFIDCDLVSISTLASIAFYSALFNHLFVQIRKLNNFQFSSFSFEPKNNNLSSYYTEKFSNAAIIVHCTSTLPLQAEKWRDVNRRESYNANDFFVSYPFARSQNEDKFSFLLCIFRFVYVWLVFVAVIFTIFFVMHKVDMHIFHLWW